MISKNSRQCTRLVVNILNNGFDLASKIEKTENTGHPQALLFFVASHGPAELNKILSTIEGYCGPKFWKSMMHRGSAESVKRSLPNFQEDRSEFLDQAVYLYNHGLAFLGRLGYMPVSTCLHVRMEL